MTADVTVIGAGIVGLATARHLLIEHPWMDVRVLEKESRAALHQSGRNSGVIHTGIYYRPGSLKARLCLIGARMLMEFCEQVGVTYAQDGKVIVATSNGELPWLQQLAERGDANGIRVTVLSKAELREIEPNVTGLAGLHVADSGTVEYASVADALSAEVVRLGGTVLTNAHVHAMTESPESIHIRHDLGEARSRFVVNCAGLHSDRVALMLGHQIGIRILPFRGEYYELTGSSAGLVRHAIYPVANPRLPFLGVHLTRRTTGVVEAGPNAVLALAREGYRKQDVSLADLVDSLSWRGSWALLRRHWRTGIDEYRRSLSTKRFHDSVRRLVPSVERSDLRRSGAGVRAQAVSSDGRLVDDFVFVRSRRSIHVLNAPSPAATASLAIGARISEEVGKLRTETDLR